MSHIEQINKGIDGNPKDFLIKDFLIGQTIVGLTTLLDVQNKKEQFVLHGGAGLRKAHIPHYPRFTYDIDYTTYEGDPTQIKNIIYKTLDPLNESLNKILGSSYRPALVYDYKINSAHTHQPRIRFNSFMGKSDYVIQLDIANRNYQYPTVHNQIIPSAIDQFFNIDNNTTIVAEILNSSMGNKLYAFLERLSVSDGSLFSRTKDIFDIRYMIYHYKMGTSMIIEEFEKRFNRSSDISRDKVRKQMRNIALNTNYLYELIANHTIHNKYPSLARSIHGLHNTEIIDNKEKQMIEIINELCYMIYYRHNK